MKQFLVFLLVFLSTAAWADNCLLIAPDAAGPSVKTETEIHPLWIKWPKATDGSGVNQLVSLIAKSTPTVSSENFQFVELHRGMYRNRRYQSLDKFEFYPELLDELLPVTLNDAPIDQGILAMAGCGKEDVAVLRDQDMRAGPQYVGRARSWDEVVEFSRRASGETLVIEFPPPDGNNYSRVWRYQAGKLLDEKDPGIVWSTAALNDLQVRESHSIRSGAPDRWLAVGRADPWMRAALIAIIWISSLVSLRFLSKEVSGFNSRIPLYLITSLVFALQFMSPLTALSGISMWWVWSLVLTAAFVTLYVVGDLYFPLGSREAYVIQSGLLLFGTIWFSSNKSPFGPVYANEFGLSESLWLCNVAIASFVFLSMKGKSGWGWTVSQALVPAMVLTKGYLDDASPYSVCLLVTWLFVIPNIFTKIFSVLIALLRGFLGAVDDRAPEWTNFTKAFDPRPAVNLFPTVGIFLRPETWIALLGSIFSVVVASRFGAHRLHRTWLLNPIPKQMFLAGIPLTICLFGNPLMGTAYVWFGSLVYLFWTQEALRDLV